MKMTLAMWPVIRSLALAAPLPAWRKLATEPCRGKQDDVHFISPDIGWYVNGTGRIFKTADGDKT